MNTRLVPSSPDSPKLLFSYSIIMREQSLSMGSNLDPYQQNNLWKKVTQAISISKQLSAGYISSVKDQKSDSNEMLIAFRKSNEETHVALENFLNSFIEQEYDNGQIMSLNIKQQHDPIQVSPGIPQCPQYRPISRSQERMPSSEGEIRSDSTNQYPSKPEFRPQSRNLNRSPSNSHIPIQSRIAYWSSTDSPNLIPYEVRNKSPSRSQDQHELDTRSMHSSVARHRPRSRNLNRSPSNYRIQKQPERRHRSRSRSHTKPKFGSRSTYSSKNRRRSQSRTREKSKSKSLDRRDNVTQHQFSSKPKHNRSSKSSKNKQGHNRHPPKNKSKKWKKSKSSQLTESTSSSDTSELEEESPLPVVNPGITTIPPTQNTCQVQSTYYPHNVAPMYYPQPTHMPRMMPVPYYMPPRPRLQYRPTYPRLMYRPRWQPPA